MSRKVITLADSYKENQFLIDRLVDKAVGRVRSALYSSAKGENLSQEVFITYFLLTISEIISQITFNHIDKGSNMKEVMKAISTLSKNSIGLLRELEKKKIH